MKRLYSAAYAGVYAESQGERIGNNDLKVFSKNLSSTVKLWSMLTYCRDWWGKKTHHTSAQSGTKGRDYCSPVELRPLAASEQMHTAVSSLCTETEAGDAWTSSAITHDENNVSGQTLYWPALMFLSSDGQLMLSGGRRDRHDVLTLVTTHPQSRHCDSQAVTWRNELHGGLLLFIVQCTTNPPNYYQGEKRAGVGVSRYSSTSKISGLNSQSVNVGRRAGGINQTKLF